MIQKIAIQKLVEFILRKIEHVNLTGLYSGKAGLSLSLFLASEYLEDEHIENIAFRLLQESLIVKNNDLSFENGLSGIGYVLSYLIQNKYLEADFDDIFEAQYETLIKSLENIEKDPLRLVNSLQIIYILANFSKFKKEDNRIPEIIKKIFEGLELFLIIQFQDFEDIHYINRKTDVLNIYKTYLKLISYSYYNHFSHSLLSNYAALYQKGKVLSSLEIGFYLKNIVDKYNIKEYQDIIDLNINNGIKNIHLDTLTLKQRIDLAKIGNNIQCKNIDKYNLFPQIQNLHNDKVIQNFTTMIDEGLSVLGYGAGLGRLLIYCINGKVELL